MKILDCVQGSDAWFRARLGIPSASNFHKILSPTGKPSTQASAYANTLLAEYLCGQPLDDFHSRWTDRGTALEDDARKFYEMQTDSEVVQVGFVVNDSHTAGCSPDGLVGDDGLLEIKCPAPHTHIGYLLDGKAPTTYYSQIQGQMHIAEREWCDFLSYHPLMPPVLVRVERDEKHIAKLTKAIDDLAELIAARKAELAAKGVTPLDLAA